MTTRPAILTGDGIRVPGRVVTVSAAAVAVVLLVALRLRAMHPGLLYPDGYQYLLMARGIGQHLTPVTTLGHGGVTLAPNADAAAKPLYPALVALGESFGLAPVDAARGIAAIAAAAVAPLAGLVTLRLGASRAGALLAAVLCLASPTLGFWFGFPGPEGLAVALGLAAAAALLTRQPLVGGALAGLAVTARPELLVVAVAVAVAASVSRRRRQETVAASTAALVAITTVLAVIRPPLSPGTLSLLTGAVLLGCLGAGALVLAGFASRRGYIGAAVGIGALLAVAIGHDGAWDTVARRDWALVALSGAGLLAHRQRATSLRIATLLVLLALAYWWKNPGSERYVAILLPGVAVLAGLGLGRLKPVALAGGAAVALAAAVTASTPSVGRDTFSAVTARLERAPAGELVTAAPDAYGALLPNRSVTVMRPGATGLVLVDGAARTYEPHLRVVGRLIARIPAGDGFLRPDGRVDTGPALLFRGRVVAR
jgi:hypothetical protein